MILIVLFVLGWLAYRQSLSSKQKKLRTLQEQWGKQKKEHFPFHLISLYSDLRNADTWHSLSAQTMTDIDFEELFIDIDRTVSKPGQQYLYHQLKSPSGDKVGLKEFDERVEFFQQRRSTRINVQQQLLPLSDTDGYTIANLLKKELQQRPSWFNWLYADLAIVILLLLLSLVYPVCLIILIIPFAFNMFLHFWNANNTFGFIRSLPQLDLLIKATEEISREELPVSKEKALNAISALRGFRKKLGYLTLGDGGMKDELAQAATYLLQVVKALFLVEVIMFFRLIRELENKQYAIADLLDYAGSIDTAIAVASLRSGGLPVCKPVFHSQEKAFYTDRIYHPLIKDCAVNSITVNGKSVLITGSNMSGKTSFLRTIAVNSLLAQTIHTCFAEAFHSPIVKLSSSIRIDDSLLEGKSYYFEEVNVMGELIRQSQGDHQNLFILDEVFKGTNTVERIAAARAILSYLNKKENLVFVATHDIELAAMLSGEYDLYHFSETIKEDHLYFDHQLRSGPLTTRNAIRILEISGYPEEIIAVARELSLKV